MKLSYRTQANAQAIAKIYNKPLDNQEWFKIIAAENDTDESEILLFDYIGWPYNDPRDLIQALADMGDVIVRINSLGGDVFDGTAIYNAFSSHKGNVTTRIEGLAASIASVIAVSGRKVQAYDNTMIMIHNAWTVALGNQFELSEVVSILSKVDVNIVNAYQKKTGKTKRDLSEMMKANTYMNADEAKKHGFIDEIVTGKSVRAEYDLSIFGEVPEGYEYEKEGGELTPREIERALRDAGASRNFAKAFIAGRNDAEDGSGQGAEDEDNQWEAESEILKSTISLFGGTI